MSAPMLSRPMQLFFSYAAADDLLPIVSSARFGFVSMVRLNLALSLARRGIVLGARETSAPPAPELPIDIDEPEGERATAGPFATLLRRHRIAAGRPLPTPGDLDPIVASVNPTRP